MEITLRINGKINKFDVIDFQEIIDIFSNKNNNIVEVIKPEQQRKLKVSVEYFETDLKYIFNIFASYIERKFFIKEIFCCHDEKFIHIFSEFVVENEEKHKQIIEKIKIKNLKISVEKSIEKEFCISDCKIWTDYSYQILHDDGFKYLYKPTDIIKRKCSEEDQKIIFYTGCMSSFIF